MTTRQGRWKPGLWLLSLAQAALRQHDCGRRRPRPSPPMSSALASTRSHRRPMAANPSTTIGGSARSRSTEWLSTRTSETLLRARLPRAWHALFGLFCPHWAVIRLRRAGCWCLPADPSSRVRASCWAMMGGRSSRPRTRITHTEYGDVVYISGCHRRSCGPLARVADVPGAQAGRLRTERSGLTAAAVGLPAGLRRLPPAPALLGEDSPWPQGPGLLGEDSPCRQAPALLGEDSPWPQGPALLGEDSPCRQAPGLLEDPPAQAGRAPRWLSQRRPRNAPIADSPDDLQPQTD